MSTEHVIARWHDTVPESLRTQPAWLCWTRKQKPGKPGKFDKVPSYANGGHRNGAQGSPEDKAKLVEFGDAIVAFRNRHFDGIGLAILPELPFWALDLDDCIGADGSMKPLAQRVIACGTYCERSPSGKGIRAIFRGKIGFSHKNHDAGVETFDSNGFVTVTGDKLGGDEAIECPRDLRDEISRIVNERAKNQNSGPIPDMPKAAADVSGLRITARIRKILKDPYPPGTDRSKEAWHIALELARAGFTREQALELMSAPEVLAPALERRQGDIESAREWLWKYCICPGYEAAGNVKATPKEADDEWPEPANIFTGLFASPFEASDVPPELAAYPTLFAQSAGFDLSLTLSAAVAVAAAALNDEFQAVGKEETRWHQSARLWILAVAPPGSAKTPSHHAMLGPLWKLHSEHNEAWRRAYDDWKRTNDSKPKDERSDDDKPPRPRIVVQDVTVEALADTLIDNPRGVLCAVDEFISWIGAQDQYRNGEVGRDRGEWLSAFEGGKHHIERIKRGSMFVPNWGVSILTGTSPAALGQLLKKHLPNDGLLQRFLLVLGKRNGIEQSVNPTAIESERRRYDEIIERIWRMAPHGRGGLVYLSGDAMEALNAWKVENRMDLEALDSMEEALGAHISKYPTMALRLALTFHAVRIATFDDPLARDPTANPISHDTMEYAFRFLRRARMHAMSFYLDREGEQNAYHIARAIGRFIVSRPDDDNAKGLTRKTLLQRVAPYEKADERMQLRAMDTLTTFGWVGRGEGGYSKAVPTRYTVNPKLAGKFRTEGERERQRRARLREMIQDDVEGRRNEKS